MNIIKFLDEFTNESLLEKKSSRRDAFGTLSSFGKKAALAAIPFGLAGASNKAFAMQSSGDPTSALELALTLEYLEKEFYNLGLESGVISDDDMLIFETISKHEDAHVAFLLDALKENAGPKPTFDFTGKPGGLDLDPFMKKDGTTKEMAYQQFMALAQGFEDTGVRAYKGQAVALSSKNDLLDYALQIHSVEARHASQVRRMRIEKGWITKAENTLPAPFAAIYAGEDNTMQGGVQLSGKFAEYGGDNALTEAFDEPLPKEDVLAIGGIFIVPEN